MTDEFYGPRSRENARTLIEAAAVLGVDVRLVRTTTGGYLVPAEVLAFIRGTSHIEEGRVYDAPKRPGLNEKKEVWVEYATTVLGLDVAVDATKDAVIDLVKNHEAAQAEKGSD